MNWPDPQQRLYRNSKDIQWVRPVHERLVGADVETGLPAEEEWALYHHKKIEKQVEQNQKYARILS